MGNSQMTYSHRRVASHLNETKSKDIFKAVLPEGWVVRDYANPDYGIDQSIEVFEKTDKFYITTGEHLFIQLKSVTHPQFHTLKFGNDKTYSLKTIKYRIDTKELYTAEKMGSALPLLLVLVCLEDSSVYYIGLNDYIQICNLILKNQKTTTIYIPTNNKITRIDAEKRLRFYSYRPKLYSLFSNIAIQLRDIEYMSGGGIRKYTNEDRKQIFEFTRLLLNNDIWNFSHAWTGLHLMHWTILCAKEYFDTGSFGESELAKKYNLPIKYGNEVQAIRMIWDDLSTLHGMFIDRVRHYDYPTKIAAIFHHNSDKA